MRQKSVGREDALDKLAQVFRETGYEGASLALLSKATGLGRASLYHHFPGGKVEMAHEVLRRIGEQAEREVLSHLRGSVQPHIKMRRFIAAVNEFYNEGRTNCIVAALVLSGGPAYCANLLKESIQLWIDALAVALLEHGLSRSESHARATNVVAQIQGSLIVSRCLGNLAPFRQMVRTLPGILLAG